MSPRGVITQASTICVFSCDLQSQLVIFENVGVDQMILWILGRIHIADDTWFFVGTLFSIPFAGVVRFVWSQTLAHPIHITRPTLWSVLVMWLMGGPQSTTTSLWNCLWNLLQSPSNHFSLSGLGVRCTSVLPASKASRTSRCKCRHVSFSSGAFVLCKQDPGHGVGIQKTFLILNAGDKYYECGMTVKFLFNIPEFKLCLLWGIEMDIAGAVTEQYYETSVHSNVTIVIMWMYRSLFFLICNFQLCKPHQRNV